MKCPNCDSVMREPKANEVGNSYNLICGCCGTTDEDITEQNRELIEDLNQNKGYAWLELEKLAEDIREWIKKDKERYYS